MPDKLFRIGRVRDALRVVTFPFDHSLLDKPYVYRNRRKAYAVLRSLQRKERRDARQLSLFPEELSSNAHALRKEKHECSK